MKFSPGNCVAIKSGGSFFAGIVTNSNDNQYEIVLSLYRDAMPPPPGHFSTAKLFCARMDMGEQTMQSLDIIIVKAEYANQSDDITLINHLNIPAFSPAVGFHPIEDFLQLDEYYQRATGLRDGTVQPSPDDVMAMATEKIFVDALDFFQQQPQANLFPTIKLYRHRDDATDYVQVYGNSEQPTFLVIHWGRIGEKSLFKQIRNRPVLELQQIYSGYIESQKSAGYQEADSCHSLTLQFKTDDSWGGTEDLDFRNAIWNDLDALLFWTGNGHVGGGDIGAGTVNLFLDVVTPEFAVTTIEHLVAKKQIDRPFIIARQDEEGEIIVIYPTDHDNEFFF